MQELPIVSRSVVWFRFGDLRIDDHPGIDSARAFTRQTVLYIVTCTSPTMASTVDAIIRLRKDLSVRGEQLHVNIAAHTKGEVEGVVQFIRETRAERVHVCSDVDSAGLHVIDSVRTRLLAAANDSPVEINTWTPQTLHHWMNAISHDDIIKQAPDIFPQYVRWRKRVTSKTLLLEPLVPFMVKSADQTSPASASPGDENTTPQHDDSNSSGGQDDDFGQQLKRDAGQKNLGLEWSEQFRKRYDEDMQLTGGLPPVNVSESGFGERTLRAYLQSGEQDTIIGVPDFGRSLNEVLRQGALSHPRIRAIVEQHERANGRVFYWAYRDAAKLVLQALEALEFSTVLARRDVAMRATVDGIHSARFWRWNGFLIRYIDEGPINPNATPVLLIHGFGASSFHFQKNVAVLKSFRRVLALDVLGFGRSDKPPMRYTTPVWEALIWDFVREVVKQPVYVAGNSIGKFSLSLMNRSTPAKKNVF